MPVKDELLFNADKHGVDESKLNLGDCERHVDYLCRRHFTAIENLDVPPSAVDSRFTVIREAVEDYVLKVKTGTSCADEIPDAAIKTRFEQYISPRGKE
jgi:hypothetical protein